MLCIFIESNLKALALNELEDVIVPALSLLLCRWPSVLLRCTQCFTKKICL